MIQGKSFDPHEQSTNPSNDVWVSKQIYKMHNRIILGGVDLSVRPFMAEEESLSLSAQGVYLCVQ